MAWEMTVSDKLGSFRANGVTYKPGIYTVDEDTARAGDRAVFGVSVREVRDEEVEPDERFEEDEGKHSGTLTTGDVHKAREQSHSPDKTGFTCDIDGCDVDHPFVNERAVNAHKDRAHKGWRQAKAKEEEKAARKSATGRERPFEE